MGLAKKTGHQTDLTVSQFNDVCESPSARRHRLPPMDNAQIAALFVSHDRLRKKTRKTLVA